MRDGITTKGGIRAKYRDDLDPNKMLYPRGKLPHRVKFYFDTKLADRPLFAFHAYARFAEYLLYCARYGTHCKQRFSIPAAIRFFEETRRVEKNILCSYSIKKPIPKSELPKLRADVTALADLAERTYNAVGLRVERCKCPVCKGRIMTTTDAEDLEMVLAKASAAGWLTEASPFYRSPVLTKVHES